MSPKIRLAKDLSYVIETTGSKTSSSILKNTVIDIQKIPTKEKDWYIFASAFFSLAEIGCDQVISSSKMTKNYKYLALSIIYNFKHGLEVIIKALHRKINANTDSSDKYHDLKKLLESFKSLKKIKGKGKLNEELQKLEKLVERYYELNFFNLYLRNSFKINDIENTFFKYPEHSTKLVIDYSSFLVQVTRTDIANIKNEIKEATKIIDNIKKYIS